MSVLRSTQEALGVMIDGYQIQVACLRREGNRMALVGLERGSLVSRLDLERSEEADALSEEDVLGISEDLDAGLSGLQEDDGDGKPETNLEALHRVLGKFSVDRCSVSLSLMQPCVSYTEFHNTAGLKGKRLRERLMSDALSDGTLTGGILSSEHHAYFSTGEDRLLSAVHEDTLAVLGLLDDLRPLLGKVQVGLIDTIEITLMNLARLSGLPASGVTAIVYVGEEFSRVIFMRGDTYLAFSQPIHEGLRSPQVLHTISSRVLYEQDLANIPEICSVVLAGECRGLQAEAFFAEKFPDARVGYLALAGLDLNGLGETDSELVSSFAVPIGLAWKTLCPKEARFYPTNFLPKARKRQQNPFEVAWHGVVCLVILAASVLLLGTKAREQAREINSRILSVNLLRDQIQEDNTYVAMVEALRVQVADYRQNLELVDLLAEQKQVLSPQLMDVASAVGETGRLWLKRFSTSGGQTRGTQKAIGKRPSLPDEMLIQGVASDLGRIPKFAERLGDATIRSMDRSEIREKAVYAFDLKALISDSE